MSYRLGVDVGGTFTDVLLVEEVSGRTWRAKTASTPTDQAVGVRTGVARVCEEAGIALSDVAQVLHGTTVATNAILEGKGATVGLVTTKGFRQVLQIARSYVPWARRLDHLAEAGAARRAGEHRRDRRAHRLGRHADPEAGRGRRPHPAQHTVGD
jgi:N-methylhydantoinase A/oxoprolinase/acetone carboxylase beta subunit